MISVVIPCYNSEKYLKECLNSIKEQSNKDVLKLIEVIIVNDGSIDMTEQIAKQYVNEAPELFKYYSIENSGVSRARNYGLSKISTESKWISFIDSDDKVSESYFEESINFFENHPDIKVAVTPIQYFGIDNKEHSLNWRFKKELSVINIEDNPTFLHYNIGGSFVSRRLLESEKMKFSEKLSFWEDALFLNTIILKTQQYGLIAKGMYYYRKEENDSLVNTSWQTSARYDELFTEGYLLLFKKSKVESGYVQRYFQYLISYHLKLFFIEKNKEVVSEFLLTHQTNFDELVNETLKEIENEVLIEPIETKFNDVYWYLYSKKNGSPNKLIMHDSFVEKNNKIIIEHKQHYELYVSVASKEEVTDITITYSFLLGFKRHVKVTDHLNQYGLDKITNFVMLRQTMPKYYLGTIMNIAVKTNEVVFSRRLGIGKYLGGFTFGKN